MRKSSMLVGLFMVGAAVLFTGCQDEPGSGEIPPAIDHPNAGYGSDDLAFSSDAMNTNPETPSDWVSGGEIDEATGVERVEVEGFPVTIYFGYDTDVLTASEAGKAASVADWLKSNGQELVLVIEGHCDERGTEEYNRALGERRAISIENYLANKGIDLAQIRTVSYGEDRPVATGSNEAAWAQNRRGNLWVGKIPAGK